MAITKSNNRSVIDWFSNATSKQTPFHLLRRSFIVADFTGSEILTDMKTNHEINRNLRDFRRLLDRSFNALVISMVGVGLA
jgi:hypothetical protein